MIYHHSLNIDFALNYCEYLAGTLTDGEKVLKTKRAVRSFLKKQKRIGRVFIPICECDNFDYAVGCLGHEYMKNL